jgi:hypothetical protein
MRYTKNKSLSSTTQEIDKLSNDARLHFSNDLLQFIDNLILIEINNKLKDDLILHRRIDVRSADEMAKDISETVFNALDKNLYKNQNETILNTNYIMTYITRRTLLTLMTAITEHNSTVLAD